MLKVILGGKFTYQISLAPFPGTDFPTLGQTKFSLFDPPDLLLQRRNSNLHDRIPLNRHPSLLRNPHVLVIYIIRQHATEDNPGELDVEPSGMPFTTSSFICWSTSSGSCKGISISTVWRLASCNATALAAE